MECLTTAMIFNKKRILNNVGRLAVAALVFCCMIFIQSCDGSSSGVSPETVVGDAEQALADGDTDQATSLCNSLLADSCRNLNEQQLGRLAIVFARLAETENGDENIADATQCVRLAWKQSNDSLRGFIATLPPEDVPLFVMLMRISGSIDFPPDLSEDPYSAEDSLHIIEQHP